MLQNPLNAVAIGVGTAAAAREGGGGGGVGGGSLVSSPGQAGPERRWTVNVITLKFMCICKSQLQRGKKEVHRLWDVQHVEQL